MAKTETEAGIQQKCCASPHPPGHGGTTTEEVTPTPKDLSQCVAQFLATSCCRTWSIASECIVISLDSLYLTRQSIPLPQPHSTSRPRARRHRQPSTHPRAPGETDGPPLRLGTTPSKRPSPPPETTHPAFGGGSHYHSSPRSPDGSPASTSMSRKNTPAAHASTPPRRTRNTSRYAPSIRAGTH